MEMTMDERLTKKSVSLLRDLNRCDDVLDTVSDDVFLAGLFRYRLCRCSVLGRRCRCVARSRSERRNMHAIDTDHVKR
jgi:hypothetical protein